MPLDMSKVCPISKCKDCKCIFSSVCVCVYVTYIEDITYMLDDRLYGKLGSNLSEVWPTANSVLWPALKNKLFMNFIVLINMSIYRTTKRRLWPNTGWSTFCFCQMLLFVHAYILREMVYIDVNKNEMIYLWGWW